MILEKDVIQEMGMIKYLNPTTQEKFFFISAVTIKSQITQGKTRSQKARLAMT